MSIRYGISLIPEPPFAARVYRARQLVCGQYASWAAEMHMLHLALAGFFQCPEDAVAQVSASLEKFAKRTVAAGGVPLAHRGVAADLSANDGGHIYLDFSNPSTNGEIDRLRSDVADLLLQTTGVAADLRFSVENFRPHISLMQHARLSRSVFDSAVEFTRHVVRDLEIPDVTRGWQLVLVRFQSAAVGDEWARGRWAADLSWQAVDSYPLSVPAGG